MRWLITIAPKKKKSALGLDGSPKTRKQTRVKTNMILSHFERLPQGTTTNQLYFKYSLIDKDTGEVEQHLLANTFAGRDPLTGRAYFDTLDLTKHLPALNAHHARAERNRNGKFVELRIHADMIEAKAIHAIAGLTPPTKGGGIRGTIQGFSRASRKRMIEFMAKARIRGQMLFATFTYPDAFPVGDVDQWNAHFEALRRRIERQFPDYAIVWRKELKPRLSGENMGKVAPHYHMIIDTGISNEPDIRVDHVLSYGRTYPKTTSAASRSFEQWSLQAWSEIVGSYDPLHAQHGCFVVACRNRRHAYKYISKYVAKEESDNFEVGRRWGKIGNWNTAPSHVVILTKVEVIQLKRLIRKWMKSKAKKYARYLATMPIVNGFTVFGIGDLAQSGDLWQRLINHAASLAGELPPLIGASIEKSKI